MWVGTATGALAAPQDFSFRGTFGADDEVALFDFTANGASTVTLRTYSYAGGTQADGTPIAAGGFDPILTHFDGTGLLIDASTETTVPASGRSTFSTWRPRFPSRRPSCSWAWASRACYGPAGTGGSREST